MTAAVFSKLLALFLTVGLGWLAGRKNWLGAGVKLADATRVLSNLALYVCVPALLFRTTARIDLFTLPWRTVAAYFVPVVGVMLCVYAWRRWQAARGARGPQSSLPAAPATHAIAAGFGNSVQLGIPMAAALFGEAGLAVHLALVSLHALVLLSVMTTLAELDLARDSPAGGAEDGARSRVWPMLRTTARNTLIHPVVMPILVGLAWNLAGAPVPAVIDEALKGLAAAVVPVCLLLIGLSLAQYGLKGRVRGALGATALKLVVVPAAVLVVARWAFGITGLPLAVAVMMAALPTGTNAIIFADRYRTLQAEATATIVFSTAAFVVTASGWLALLAWMAR
jgi:malonate transporter and related proteins